MREFRVKGGRFAGQHRIYDNPAELLKHEGVDFVRHPWWDENAKVGEWCRLDDGFIMQLLRRSELVDKKGKLVEVYRFAVGSRGVYVVKDGTRKSQLLYSTNPSANKSALVTTGYDRSIGGSYDSRKKLWVNLVADGMEPLEASKKVYNEYSINKITSITNKLIEDTKIRKYVMKAMVPFKQEVEEKIAEATGGSTLNEQIALSIAKIIEAEPRSIKDMSMRLKILLDIGTLTGDVPSKLSNKKVAGGVETDFQEVEPPKLGENEE